MQRRLVSCPAELQVNVVAVYEQAPTGQGIEPLEWVLLTTEPIGIPE